VAWDAGRGAESPEEASLAAAIAAGLAVDAAVECAKDCVQVLGGIGFTWEHDAHLYLRRAMSAQALLCGTGPWYDQAATLALGGVRRALDADLPAEAEEIRPAAAADAASFKAMERDDRQRAMAEAGYVMPHWPEPWGRDASALEQVVIDEELRRAQVRRPHLAVGAWVLPTIIAHGTPGQQERWIPATLAGETTWCQLFSEPGAGSDLASLTTKAVRTDGGWLLSGQKVWTTMAGESEWGICLARTNPDAPKHQGITCFLVDMTSDGIDIRPLKEITGAEMFNEVFLSDVFVSDDCVVGEVDDGWRVGRTTLANERVSMGSGASFGVGIEGVLALVGDRSGDPHVRQVVGRLVAEEHALAVLGLRMTLRALSGAEPGPESSVRKLLGVEHDQRVQEVGFSLLAAEGAFGDGDGGTWSGGFLLNRCLTIAGGTSEVQRNVIAERLLGLPRDPP
jgi:alkylation response protein AidB-like acyl-CoA dehydrogenase